MAESPNLGITHLTQAQNQKHVTVNTAIDQLDGCVAGIASGTGIDFPSDADFTPAATDVQGALNIFVAGTISVIRDYNLPTTSHLWLVSNETVGGFDVNFQVTGGAGLGVVVANGAHRWVWSDGVDVILAGGESPYELGAFVPGTPGLSTMIYKVVMARPVIFPDDFVGSQGHAGTAPSGAAVDFDVKVNSVSIGTMSFADGIQTATFVSTGPDQLVAGDRFEVHTPADLKTMANVSFMFTGTR